MKFGMFYVLESPDGEYQRAYWEMFSQIEYAEELGFDSVWLAEHHGSAYGSIPSGAVAAAAIGGLEDHKVRDSMKRFAEEVMPYFKDDSPR